MLFRRVLQHVKHQNWLAVAIDFVIVVVGVFIGIQLGNWNEARIERTMERQYVLQLHEDMRRSAAAIADTNAYLEKQVADERVLLDSLEACRIAPSDEPVIAAALGALGKFVFAAVDRDLVDQLRASGQFEILRERELRDRIVRMAQASDEQLRVEPQWLQHSTQWTNYARRLYFFDSPETVHSGRWESWDNLRFEFERACEDFEFVSAVGNTREATRNLYHWNAAILARVEEAEEALQAEIDARGWGESP